MENPNKLFSFEEWKKIENINEDVTIPAALSTQYLSVKKQISDKQTKKDQILKAANQIDTEINVLTQNLIGIESKAAAIQGQIETKKTEAPKETQQGEKTTESLDLAWEKYINEDIATDLSKYPQLDIFAPPSRPIELQPTEIDYSDDNQTDYIKDYDDDYEEPKDDEQEIDGDVEGEKSLEGDFVFTISIVEDGADEDIIAKIYKDDEEENWKVRVVQGSEEPLEDMQFDSSLSKEEVIDKIMEIPGFSEIEEVEIEEYEDMVDDKEENDEAYYDDILDEK